MSVYEAWTSIPRRLDGRYDARHTRPAAARRDRGLAMQGASPDAPEIRTSEDALELQNGYVYGPVSTRRLGRSLGVNLAPSGRKACNFECAYCRYDWTAPAPRREWPAVDRALAAGEPLDAITVAGNGEPIPAPVFV
jgi:hypothetical protein